MAGRNHPVHRKPSRVPGENSNTCVFSGCYTARKALKCLLLLLEFRGNPFIFSEGSQTQESRFSKPSSQIWISFIHITIHSLSFSFKHQGSWDHARPQGIWGLDTGPLSSRSPQSRPKDEYNCNEGVMKKQNGLHFGGRVYVKKGTLREAFAKEEMLHLVLREGDGGGVGWPGGQGNGGHFRQWE